MNGFEYRYKTLEDVIKSSTIIVDLQFTEQILLLVVIIATILTINYLIPFFILAGDYKKELKEKRKKKQLLKQIILQKEIENEIENEIKEEESKII